MQKHRERLRQRGLKRVEVEAAESDASLIRQLAKVLREDDAEARRLRRQLAAMVGAKKPGLKALLAQAPLEGVRITRSRDRGHIVEL